MRVRSPRFVGRKQEIEALTGWLENAVAGRPRVVVIGGEAGVGKSRLVEEFSRMAVDSGARVFVGAAADFGEGGLPFGALAEALRPALRESAGLPSLLEGIPDGQDRLSQGRAFERLLDFLLELSRDRSLVLVLEDLHWADASTREFVAFLARNLRQAPVLVLATYRSDDVGRDHPLHNYLVELRRGPVELLILERFDRLELREQMAAIRGSPVDETLVDALFERSQGNAFFTEELMASTVADEPPAKLPPTLRDTMLARLDRLSQGTQGMLAGAAVAGIFDEGLLTSISDMDPEGVRNSLREAIERGVLQPLSDEGYTFRHALLREAIYEDLLASERTRLHRSIAELLSGRVEKRMPEAWVLAGIAHHWDLGGQPQQAFQAAWRAAVAADLAYARHEASRLFLRVAELWEAVDDPVELLAAELASEGDSESVPDRATVIDRAAQSAEAYDEGEAMRLWQRAATEVDVDADTDRFAMFQESVASLGREVGDPVAAAQADAALAEVFDRVSPTTRAQLLIASSDVALLRGSFEQALVQTQEAVALAELTGRAADRVRALINAGRALGYMGRIDEARSYFSGARSEADPAGRGLAVATADKWEGDLLQGASRFDDGVTLLRSAIRGLVDVGQTSDAFHARAIVAQALHRAGRWNEATAELDDSNVAQVRWSRVVRAYLLVGQGRFDEAQRELEEMAEFVSMSGSTATNGPYHAALAEMSLWKTQPAAALDTARLGLSQMTQDLRWIGELTRLGLWAAADLGDSTLDEAEELLRNLFDHAERARATGTIFEPEIRGALATAKSEMTRVKGSSDSALWQEAAEVWLAIPEPYPAAYALFRRAEAMVPTDRKAAAEPLKRALVIAADLGASPLREAVEALARRAGVHLERSETTTADSYGLTPREREVLALMAHGASDRQIADRLFISPKTASVHVSNVKGKLGVTSRIEAATIGIQLGLARNL